MTATRGNMAVAYRKGRTEVLLEVDCTAEGQPWRWEATRLARQRLTDAGRADSWEAAYRAGLLAVEQLLAGRVR